MPKIAIATMTWARTPPEEELLFDSLSCLSALGLPVVATEGGSAEAFVRRLHSLPNLQLLPQAAGPGPRLISQVQASFSAAATLDPEYVLYTEPDKRGFFTHRLGAFLSSLDLYPDAGMVIAARDAGSFATFPEGQRLTETLANQLFSEVFGQEGDYNYGPFLLRATLLRSLEAIREDVGWGWRPFLMAVSHRLGLPVVCHPMDLPCPEEQRGEDDPQSRLYRMEQLAQNVRGVVLGLKTELME